MRGVIERVWSLADAGRVGPFLSPEAP